MGKVAFIFPGQGAQYVGMGKEIAENHLSSKLLYEEANEELNFNLMKMCFEGPEELLNETENTQPAILATSIAILKVVEENGIKCDAAAGLSLGEYTSLVCSGVFDYKAAIRLVKQRGKFMQDAVPKGIGSMAALIGLDVSAVNDVCEAVKEIGYVEAANYNCPGQIVIAGETEAVKYACDIAKSKGAKMAVMLSVSIPSHTKMLAPAAEKLENELNKIHISKMKIPVLTNVTGNYIENESVIKDLLKKQVMSPVHWDMIIKQLKSDGFDTFVEIGPGKTLSSFVKKIDRSLKTYNVEDMKSLEKTILNLKNS